MYNKTITIESTVLKKGKIDSRSLPCRVFESGNMRTYILDKTNRELVRKRFFLYPGCKIIDDGITLVVDNIWYPTRPRYPHLIVCPKATV